MVSVTRELILALCGVLGDVFYLDSSGSVVLDPSFPLSAPERSSVSSLLPLASAHVRLRLW